MYSSLTYTGARPLRDLHLINSNLKIILSLTGSQGEAKDKQGGKVRKLIV